jgi:hypothetical protein
MHSTQGGRVTVGGLGLILGVLLVVIMAAVPPKGTADPIGRQTSGRTAYDDMGRAARGSREFPTTGTSILTRVGEEDGVSGPGTGSGGAYIQGLGTVSHASIDNNFARLMDQARTASDTRTGS